MSHVVKELPWAVIDIDTAGGRIFFQQRWKYNWAVQPPLSFWTYKEKKEFHDNIDRRVWSIWSDHVHFKVQGSSAFAKRFQGKSIPINFDIRWVLANEHWNVTVWKIPANRFRTSSISWTSRQITLDTNDYKIRTICDSATPSVCTNQVPIAHEFGHSAGNTAVLNRGDEYKTSSSYINDKSSIMNVGSQLRNRHFRTIIEEMNKMIPGSIFSVHSIK